MRVGSIRLRPGHAQKAEHLTENAAPQQSVDFHVHFAHVQHSQTSNSTIPKCFILVGNGNGNALAFDVCVACVPQWTVSVRSPVLGRVERGRWGSFSPVPI